MATPDVIDFDKLLAPVSDESPSGSDVREDFSMESPYFALKEAQGEARTAERKRREAFDEVPDTEFHTEDWEPVLQQAEEILAHQAKDLEVAAWYLEALLRRHGFAGLRDGLRLIRELVDRYWDGIFPRPDEDGAATIVAPIEALNGTLTFPVSNIPLTGMESWGDWQYRQAQTLQDVPPEELEDGAVTLPLFDAAVSGTPLEFFRDLIDDLGRVQDELEQLTSLLEDRCGVDDSGFPVAPSINDVQTSVADVLQTVKTMTSGLNLEFDEVSEAAPDVAPAAGAVEAPASPGAPASGDVVTSREQAFRQIQQLADYFKKVEPHSPTAYLLEKAVRWGRYPFPRLMKELVQDEPTLTELYRVMGIGAAAEDDFEDEPI